MSDLRDIEDDCQRFLDRYEALRRNDNDGVGDGEDTIIWLRLIEPGLRDTGILALLTPRQYVTLKRMFLAAKRWGEWKATRYNE